MNKTLNQITDRLEQLSVDHHQINDFGHGDTSEIGTHQGRELGYPYMHIDYAETRYAFGNNRGIGYKIYTMTVLVVDKITPNIYNSPEVMSDCEGILSDIIQFVSTDSTLRDFRIETADITADPVSDEDKDGTEGWVARIPFKIPYSYCATKLPFVGQTGGTTPLESCAATNSDGTYNQVIPGGSTLTVPDSTITVNGISYKLLPATIALDIDVVDSDGAAKGTIVGTDVVIADSTVTNTDGSYTEVLKAEEDLTLPDLSHTDSDGSTVSGVAQAGFTCTPQVQDLFLYINYVDTNDVVEVLGDSNNIGTYTTIPSGMEYSTDGVNYVALTSPFTLLTTVNYYFKRLTALVSETKTMGGTYV